jgi:hypothetical protein
MAGAREFGIRHIACLAGAATAVFCSVACGSSCTGEGCGLYSRISATLRGASPWTVTLCANDDCTTCDLTNPGSGRPGGDAGAAASSACASWNVAPGAGGTPLLDIAASSPPSYPEGASLTLNVVDATGASIVDWKGTAHYTTHTIGGADCDNQSTCRSLDVEVPAS